MSERVGFMKVMPCGYVRTGVLSQHLDHYRDCLHEACHARITEWEAIKKQAKEANMTIPEILDKTTVLM